MAGVLKIQIDKETHPKAYHPNVGDIVQCYIDFALTPETIVRDIVVFVDKPHLVEIGTAITSDFTRAGGGQMSAFFYVQDAGLLNLRLIPVIPGEIAKEHVIAILAEQP